jgi:ribosomal protein S8
LTHKELLLTGLWATELRPSNSPTSTSIDSRSIEEGLEGLCRILFFSTMSLVNLSHVCSHLTNASKARLGLTSIPNSNLHLRLTLALQNAGFISTVVRGGPTPPPPHLLLSHPESNDVEPVTQNNIASRRLWLGLKYWQSEPVLSKMTMISKPTRRIHMDSEGLRDIVRGKKSGYVDGLRSPGECLFLSTDRGVLEARECVEKKLGGLILCRAV